MPELYISAIISQAWGIFKKKWLAMYGVMLLPLAIGIIFNIFVSPDMAGYPLLMVVYFLLQLVVGLGVVRAYFALVRDTQVSLSACMPSGRGVLNYVLTVILVTLITLAGILFFILPGIYFSLKYAFAAYISADNPDMGPLAVLEKSGKMTKGIKWDIVGVGITFAVLMYSGLLALLLGIFVSIPVAILSYVLFYELCRKRLDTPALEQV